MAEVLSTQRLRLRHQTPDDAAVVMEILNDPAFLTYVGDRGLRTVEQARTYIREGAMASYRRHGFGLWLVERVEDGAAAGICGLVRRDFLEDVDLGFAFLPAYRGLGYATEAAEAVRELAFVELGLERLVAIVSPQNGGSIRVLEKLGFAHEGPVRLPGEDEDILLYGLAKGSGRAGIKARGERRAQGSQEERTC